VEDLAALVELAGGSAAVFGYSSGAVLALKAAADGVAITHLALYEAPIALDAADRGPADLPQRLAELVEQGRPGDAVALFQTAGIGLPPELVAQMRQSPMWPGLEAMAQSVVYDATLTSTLAVPTAGMTAVTTPTLILIGAQTWPKLAQGARALAGMMPGAQLREVAGGQDHDIPTLATAAAVRELLART
jgi:hypothetical protein